MSSGCRNGYSARIVCSVSPAASIPRTCSTAMRMSRMIGFPPKTSVRTVMRLRSSGSVTNEVPFRQSLFERGSKISFAHSPKLPRKLGTGLRVHPRLRQTRPRTVRQIRDGKLAGCILVAYVM